MPSSCEQLCSWGLPLNRVGIRRWPSHLPLAAVGVPARSLPCVLGCSWTNRKRPRLLRDEAKLRPPYRVVAWRPIPLRTGMKVPVRCAVSRWCWETGVPSTTNCLCTLLFFLHFRSQKIVIGGGGFVVERCNLGGRDVRDRVVMAVRADPAVETVSSCQHTLDQRGGNPSQRSRAFRFDDDRGQICSLANLFSPAVLASDDGGSEPSRRSTRQNTFPCPGSGTKVRDVRWTRCSTHLSAIVLLFLSHSHASCSVLEHMGFVYSRSPKIH